MEENDFKRLETMLEQRDRKVREEISGDTQRKVEVLRQEINYDFKHHVGILTEDLNHKLQTKRPRKEVSNSIFKSDPIRS